MEKDNNILESIKHALKGTENKSKNSMGVREDYYDPYYLVGKCFDLSELEKMSSSELQNIIKLANFASDTFY